MSKKKLIFVSCYRDELDGIYGVLEKHFPNQLEYKRAKLDEFQGDEDTVVRKKCLEALKHYGAPVFVESTSLCFDAFLGLPGPYTKYFVNRVGHEGLYRMLSDWDNKNATAACRIALCETPTSEPVIFKGVVRGTLVKPRALAWNGFDVCFKPADSFLTYSQMSPDIREKVSYHYLAVKEMADYLQNKSDSQM